MMGTLFARLWPSRRCTPSSLCPLGPRPAPDKRLVAAIRIIGKLGRENEELRAENALLKRNPPGNQLPALHAADVALQMTVRGWSARHARPQRR